jgi:hypothetical protein
MKTTKFFMAILFATAISISFADTSIDCPANTEACMSKQLANNVIDCTTDGNARCCLSPGQCK